MILTDTHSHLYDHKFSEDRTEMIDRALKENVQRIFLPNVDSKSVQGMMEVVADHPDKCFPMIGLHPCNVMGNYNEELTILKDYLDNGSFVAVGEIGMDLYWDKTFLDEQKESFRTQIHWAKDKGLPVVIHCRDAFKEVFEILDSEKGPLLRGVFHCFTGSIDQAHRAIDLNFYLGIGGVVTFKKAGLDSVVKQIPLKHIVLETDSPYLSPSPNRGKRNESAYLIHIARKVADLHEVTMEELAKITTNNSKQLFGR